MEGISTAPATSTLEINEIFERQRGRLYEIGNTSASERIKKLKRFQDALIDNKEKIREAIHNDFLKNPNETDLTELLSVIGEIKHAIRHLKQWMRPHKVSTPLLLLGTKSFLTYESKGVALILAPWNFPINLTLGPLVSAIAAGNCVIVKPSELTKHTSRLIKHIVESLFDADEIAVVEGGKEISQALLQLPFNHIFFTGSPKIGRIVMEAASKHLSSVTLELGGKSPTIVDKSADINIAARRIAWGKFLNNGQTCIAPDYVFVHEDVKEEFVENFRKHTVKLYGNDPSVSEAYCRIINNGHYQRILEAVEESTSQGAEVISTGKPISDEKYVPPTIVMNVKFDSKLMQEEIFGPVLPVIPFDNIEEPIKLIQSREIPLALYIFSKNKRNINEIISRTRAGGTVVNHSLIHFYQNNLPFGGSNESGIGKAHGFFGFRAFSNERAIIKQSLFLSGVDAVMPPYTKWKQKFINLAIRWL